LCGTAFTCVARHSHVWHDYMTHTGGLNVGNLVLYCSVLPCAAVRCSALQCVAVRYSALQCVAVCGSVFLFFAGGLCVANRAVCRSVPQFVTGRCSALQGVVMRCRALQCVAVRCSALPQVCALGILHEGERFHVTHWNDFKCHTATHCDTLRHTATHCNTLQHTAIHYYRRSARWESCMRESDSMSHVGMTSNATLQHTATHCDTLQHTATHCNTLQHTATHCYTLLPEVCALGILHERKRLAEVFAGCFDPFLVLCRWLLKPVCCSVVQCVAVCCSVLECVGVCWSVLECVAMCCNVLQCV